MAAFLACASCSSGGELGKVPLGALPDEDVVAVAGLLNAASEKDTEARLYIGTPSGSTVYTRELSAHYGPRLVSNMATLWVADDEKVLWYSRKSTGEVSLRKSAGEGGIVKAMISRPSGGVFVLVDLGTEDGIGSYRHRLVEIAGDGSVVAEDALDRMIWSSGLCDGKITLFAGTATNGSDWKYSLEQRTPGVGAAWSVRAVTVPTGVKPNLDANVCDGDRLFTPATSSDDAGEYRLEVDTSTAKTTVLPLKNTEGASLAVDGVESGQASLVNGHIFWVDYDKRILRTEIQSGSTSVAWDGRLGAVVSNKVAVAGVNNNPCIDSTRWS